MNRAFTVAGDVCTLFLGRQPTALKFGSRWRFLR
jgi:hypothetical protein